LSDELSPRVAGGADDVVVGFEDAVGEPIGAQILPDVFDRVQLGRTGRQKNRRMFWGIELSVRMPPRTIKLEDGVRAVGNIARDFIVMKLHGGGVGEGQGERLPRAGHIAPKRLGVFVALIGRLASSYVDIRSSRWAPNRSIVPRSGRRRPVIRTISRTRISRDVISA
jgi:hypothetical protein